MYEAPTFITERTVSEIEKYLLNDEIENKIIDYKKCRGISHDAFIKLMTLITEYEKLSSKEVKQKGKDKKFNKLFRKMENENEHS